MKEILLQLTNSISLTEEEMIEAVQYLFSPDITDSEIAAFLVSLKAKGETVNEIATFVKTLRAYALTFDTSIPHLMDNCGTGGDGSKSFNISTTSAFVIAASGIPVAKHGNRSVSSKTGSADVLEHLGIRLDLSPQQIEGILEKIGIAFLFAPNVHPQIKRIMKVRQDLRIPTTFNLLGPLINPMNLENQLLGIYKRDAVEMFAEVLQKLGRKRAVVINGAGYMDEASLQGENYLAILKDGNIQTTMLHPEEVGLHVYANEKIRGGYAKENAAILLRVLDGEKGAYRETVALNAGIGIFVGGRTESIKEGVQLALEIIDSGAAMEKLEQLKALSVQSTEKVI
ncbi:anthranilate phosphoribosyltransferase [Cytobacillus kochii]|uniref:anthranilate phosphoribosyltransferase n=1 Tax=Cytobacillus TaxID=2675230 RepID=UPI001CD4BA5F|nr:anthranilate phosphoribosyltransferase [Cytobacillus kochii]MCA1028289.1 anthranilate phosphoribosyltransferase [Cytobacillus kochii]